MHPSPWWATATVYQLYVRSFADGDGDGIGDLQGIRDRLDHIASLGVDAIWLNPCYPSPQRDHGYDVSDYFSIEPDYGTMQTFDALLADARDRGIRIMMDVVPNHCSNDHEWFRKAVAAGPGSPERDRFWFRDGRGPDGAEPPNNWQAIFGGSAWTRVTEPDGEPGQWYLGVFTPHQPDLNWANPDVVGHFDDMLRFWFDRGVEGFRVDAVTVLGKAEGLPDGPELPFGRPSPWFNHQPSGHAAWRHWRRVVDDYNAANGRACVIVAEAYTPGQIETFAGYVNPGEFHQGFAFDLLLSPWRADAFRTAVEEMTSLLLPAGIAPAWTLNNHDNERTPTRYGRPSATQPVNLGRGNHLVAKPEVPDLEVGARRAMAATMFMLGLPGAAYLYMGEEFGLPEVLDLPDDVRQDPLFHLTRGRQRGRDGCRVPLPWSTGHDFGHGFSPAGSTTPPWLPQPVGWGSHVADEQVLGAYRRVLQLRREVLGGQIHDFRLLATPEDLLAYRHGPLTVLTNFGSDPMSPPADIHAGLPPAITSGPTPTAVIAPDTTAWFVAGG